VSSPHAWLNQPPPSPAGGFQPVEVNYEYLVGLLDKWTTSYSTKRLAVENSLPYYSAYLLVSLKLIEFFTKSDKKSNRIKFLRRLTNHITTLIEKHGFPRNGQTNVSLFIAILLYLECETSATDGFALNLEINNKIAEEMKELEDTIVPGGNLLGGQEFRKQVTAKWDELKLTPTNPDQAVLTRLISSLVAATLLAKDPEARMGIYREIVKDIADVRDDTDALFLSYILQFPMAYDADNKANLRQAINKRQRERRLRGFRRILYGDILT
jgi:hypothetical protein